MSFEIFGNSLTVMNDKLWRHGGTEERDRDRSYAIMEVDFLARRPLTSSLGVNVPTIEQ